MALMVITLLPVLGISVWWYQRCSPAGLASSTRRTLDRIVLLVACAGSVGIWWHFYRFTATGPDGAWWPLLAFFGTLVYLPTVLLAGAIARTILSRSVRGRGDDAE